jgi:predicted dehydrogenase
VISSGTERSRVLSAQKSLFERARERPDLVKAVAQKAISEGFSSTRRAVQQKLSEGNPVGYSSAGTVLEVGAAVAGFAPDDRVACAGAGHANHAEIVSVPANLCVRVPDDVPLETASLSAVAAIALHSVRLGGITIGDRVAVVGCGLVGQIVCRLLRCAGAEIVALDVDEGRLEDARRSGAHHALLSRPGAEREVLEATRGIGVDCSIVAAATSSNQPLLLAANVARDRGALVIVGDVPVDLPREPLYRKELVLRVSRSYGPGRYDLDYEERGLDYPIGYVRWTEKRNMECVLDLQARRELDLSDLVDAVFSVDAAAEAYDRLAADAESRPRGALLLSYPDDREPPFSTGRTTAGSPKPALGRLGTEPVRVGLIGPGQFARSVIIPNLVAAGATLETVGGGAGPSADAVARQFGFARVAGGEREIIDDGDVDAVVICARHGSHAALATAALEAGKHVFCEKPLALSVDELSQVMEAAEQAVTVLAVGFNRRFSPLLQELRTSVAGGDSPLTMTYRVAAGHLPAEHWTNDLEQGGGRILGEACHFVDSLRYLCGADVTQVHAVSRDDDKPIQARDNVIAALSFADGSIGTIVYAADVGPGVPKERIEAHSRTSSGAIDDFRDLQLYPASPTKRRGRGQEKGHRQELEAFIAAVRSGSPPVPLAEVENVSMATLAIVESLRTGKPVRLTP